MGLAVGFILGGAVSKLVSSFVTDIINPLVGLLLGAVGGLREAYLQLGPSRLYWGSFINAVIDFVIIALVIYFGVKILKLDKLDKKKD